MTMIASIVIILILVAGFAYYYSVSSGKISALNSTVSDQSNQILGDQSTITQLQGAVSTLQGNVTSLQGSVANLNAMVASLQGTISSDQSKLSSLQGQVNADNSTISALKTQISSDVSALANLTAIIDLQQSTVETNAASVTIYGNQSTITPFLTFSPNHAGYLLVQVSGATEGYLVDSMQSPSAGNSGGATFESISGLSQSSPGVAYFIIPVVPGSGASFALIANAASNGSATVTATFYY